MSNTEALREAAQQDMTAHDLALRFDASAAWLLNGTGQALPMVGVGDYLEAATRLRRQANEIERLRARLEEISKHSGNTIRTNSRDRDDWLVDVNYICNVATDALAAPVAVAEPASGPPLVAPQAWQALADTANHTLERAERREARNAASEPLAPDWLLRSTVADLLHLLQFSSISTSAGADDVQARKTMASLRRMLAEGPQPAPARVPLTLPQLRRLWDNSPERHADCTSRAAFIRVATLVLAATGITAQGEPK